MIVDRLQNIELYKDVCPHVEKAIEFIKRAEGSEAGRYDEGEIYSLIQKIETVPATEKKFELHRKYIDIHYVMKGVEVIEWEVSENLSATDEYNPENDIQWLTGIGVPFILHEGMFCITFPSDGHKSGCCLENSAYLEKILVKIPVG